MVSIRIAVNEQVIEVSYQENVDGISKYRVHERLECVWGVTEAHWHEKIINNVHNSF